MSEPSNTPQPGEPAVARRSWPISLVWLVPIVAALVGLSMLVHAWMSAGTDIQVRFDTAAGLEAGKTAVKYKDVTVGAVTAIALSDDGSHVVATVSLDKSATKLTRRDTRFWVVRPRIGAGGVSGFDTLLSGAYIAADAGHEEQTAKSFVGLETPPTVVSDTPGKSFVLHTEDLGSLGIGSPLYYRRIQVGQVAGYQLAEDGKTVRVQVFVNAPYDRFVTTDTRFWNASGVDISLGADGLKLKTQSVSTIVSGGVAFGAPSGSQAAVAAENSEFTLAQDEQTALAPPDGPAQYIRLRFEQSLRGLAVGAPVQLSGVDLGRVVSMELDYDPGRHSFPTEVGIVVYPQRLGRVLQRLPKMDGGSQEQAAQLLRGMVEHGLRAQARSGNLLTGQLYISLDFVPNASKVAFDPKARPLTLPTIGSSFDRLQEQMASIVGKIDKIPLDSIGRNLDATLADLDRTLKQVNGQVLPQTTQTLQQASQAFSTAQGMLADDAPLQQNLGLTLEELRRSARSLRTLTDLLGEQPEALLRGRRADDVRTLPPAPTPAKGSKESR